MCLVGSVITVVVFLHRSAATSASSGVAADLTVLVGGSGTAQVHWEVTGGTGQELDTPLPWTTTIRGGDKPGSFVTATLDLVGRLGKISCSLTAGGRTVDSSKDGTSVTCAVPNS
jgi:hypothetical protein